MGWFINLKLYCVPSWNLLSLDHFVYNDWQFYYVCCFFCTLYFGLRDSRRVRSSLFLIVSVIRVPCTIYPSTLVERVPLFPNGFGYLCELFPVLFLFFLFFHYFFLFKSRSSCVRRIFSSNRLSFTDSV